MTTITQQPEAKATESRLPATHHEAFRNRLAGAAVQDIAKEYGKRRETIWRWLKAVETEYRATLEFQPTINLISQEAARLTDIEHQARESAARTKSDRCKVAFLGEARRAATARQNLLMAVGVIPKEPERLYTATISMRPDDLKPDGKEPSKSRDEAIGELIEAMQGSARL